MQARSQPLSPGEMIQREMEARGWDCGDVAGRMGTYSPYPWVNEYCLRVVLENQDRNLVIDPESAAALGAAFDLAPQHFLDVDRAWRLGPHPQ
jgi:plasmid maintenance system antidote protein VapI